MKLELLIAREAGEETDASAEWLSLLGQELSELDDVNVAQAFPSQPDGAKGAGGLGGLLASLPGMGLAAVMAFLRAWAVRTGRTIEVSAGDDTIKITGASKEQQDRIVEAWIARYTAST